MATRRKAEGGDAFAARLETYYQTEADLQEDLTVPSKSVVTLSAAPQHASARRPQVLHTTDLDELTKWIGVSDEVARGRSLVDQDARRHLKSLVAATGDKSAKELRGDRTAMAARLRAEPDASSRLEAVRSFARSYLYGDSKLVAEAKPVIEEFFGVFEIYAWRFRKVTVSSGSVLVFGSGANVLTASELEIEQGGRIVSYGSLTVNVSTLRKTKPLKIYEELDLSLIVPQEFRRLRNG